MTTTRRQNWAKEAAEKLRQETINPDGSLKLDNPEPALALEPASQPAPQPAPEPAFQPASQPAPQPAPQPEPMPQPVAPTGPSATEAALAAELAAVRSKLLLEQAERARESELLREASELKRQREIEAALDFDDADLPAGSIDPEDARTLTRKVYEAAAKDREALAQELAQLKTQIAQQHVVQEEKAMGERLRRTNAEIFRVHPNFQQIQQTPAFQAAMAQAVRPGSRITEGTLVEDAYNAGDAQYVIDFVTRVVNGQPVFADVAQVAPTATAVATPEAEEKAEPSVEELDDLLNEVRSGKISPAQFRIKRRELLGAGAA